MNVTEAVINDLLPLYAANECSADTRALVDAYLQTHPEVAARLADATRTALRGPIPTNAIDTAERQALARTQRLLNQRTWFMAMAIFFTLLPFSFIVSNGQFRWLLHDSPTYALAYGAIGAVVWIVYFVWRRRLHGSW